MITKAAHQVRRATQILPPLGVGIGAGIGLGCGFGWPLKRAYGPPVALCGPAIGVGFGVGYGQGFGRRFGKDIRPDPLVSQLKKLERTLDECFVAIIASIRAATRKLPLPSPNK